MRPRPYLVFIGLLISVCLVVLAQQKWIDQLLKTPIANADTAEQQMMTPVTNAGRAEDDGLEDLRKSFIADLGLKRYEAVIGGLSMCANDEKCLKDVEHIQFWLCAAGACEGTGKSKDPTACNHEHFDMYSVNEKEQINTGICNYLKSPGAETRKELISHLYKPIIDDNGLVETMAYILALKGSAVSCEDAIKDYIGPYGPRWSSRWYVDLSGCRILAHARTRDQEEKDFYTWFGVKRGLSSCSDIVDSEMRDACNAPGASSKTGL